MKPKQTKATSLSTAIFLPNFLLSITALIALSVVLTLVVGRLTANSMDDRLQTTQRLFIETVSQDYLTGSYAQVYRKCKALVSNKLIKAVKITDRNGQPICDISAPENQATWNWTQTPIYYDEAGTQIAAQVSLAYSTAISRQIFLNSFFLILGAILVTALIQFLLSRRLAVSVSSPITNLADALNKGLPSESAVPIPTYQAHFFREIREVSILFDSIQILFRRIGEYQKQLVDQTRQAAVGEVAAQVAHDIRSPLAALESVVEGIDQLPEEHRILVRSATNRVRDIANDLLRQKRRLDAEISNDATPMNRTSSTEDTAVWLLSGLIDSLISEKRFHFRSKIGIEINAKLGHSAYGLFASVNQVKFQSILSNLINNSVDAIDDHGQVTVTVAPDGPEQLVVTVEDTGKGIPTNILPKLMQEGHTFKKSGGSGLGLYGARLAVESWGGTIQIQSTVGKGTTVTLRLPRAGVPAWFVPSLPVRIGHPIVVLDDDASIHQIWQKRFDGFRSKDCEINVSHLTSPKELEDWIFQHQNDLKRTLFLVDFELLGHQKTGLDLIVQHRITEQSILVTSRYDDKDILDRLTHHSVRLIPKGLAPFVPITMIDSGAPVQKIDCVLIDDDTIVHMSWKLAIKKTDHRMAYFFTATDFLTQSAQFDKDTIVYIDSNLGNGVHGEEISKDIFALGFKEIYLITGYSQAQFPALPHIRKIRGKEPPW